MTSTGPETSVSVPPSPLLFWVRPEFLECLKTVGASEKILSIKQILGYLNKYIIVNKLYNELEPTPRNNFYLGEDKLAKVFGCKHFNVEDLRRILPYQLVAVTNKKESSDSNLTGSTAISDGDRSAILKRKLNDGDSPASTSSSNAASVNDSDSKKSKEEIILFKYGVFTIPSFPKYESGDETDCSVQSLETELATNSGDDVLLCEGTISIEEYHRSLNNIPTSDDDLHAVEYEVESVSSMSDGWSDTSSDTEDFVCAALLIGKDDSDMPFWADESDEDNADPELSLADKWSCNQCGSYNEPLNRFCYRCWDMRVHWLPDQKKNRPPNNLKKKQRPPKKNIPVAKVLPIQSRMNESDESLNSPEEVKEKLNFPESLPSTSKSQSCSSSGEFSQDSGFVVLSEANSQFKNLEDVSDDDASGDNPRNVSMCPICHKRPKTGVFVHGSKSHQYCCYKCAKIIQKSGKRCPVCRRNISTVLRNFIV